MPKYTNVVRFRVKSGKQQEFENVFSNAETWGGQLLHILARTGQQTYVAYGLWESEERMADARPQMIRLLDSTRDLLEELSPELGVTDPVSGTVVFEKQIN
ncbi:MAG: antibiotic biosynthesis monooxygenase [Pseudomonadota bacterium]|nr:antibiotic biosynthesis monooxygenase [Pseudomonadota bacterium]